MFGRLFVTFGAANVRTAQNGTTSTIMLLTQPVSVGFYDLDCHSKALYRAELEDPLASKTRTINPHQREWSMIMQLWILKATPLMLLLILSQDKPWSISKTFATAMVLEPMQDEYDDGSSEEPPGNTCAQWNDDSAILSIKSCSKAFGTKR